MVRLRYAEKVGDGEHGERLAVVADELAAAAVDELVDLAIGEPPHELLVVVQPLRRDQPHQQRAVQRVLRRIEGEDLVAERQLVAVLLDQRAHVVVALERYGEAGERPGRGVARRERVGVVVHRDRFFVPRHHRHAVVAFRADGALRTEPLEVAVRVGNELVAAEEVGRVVVSHSTARGTWGGTVPRVVPVGPISFRFVDFSLSDAEQDLVGLCRDFAQNEIARRAPQAWHEARCATDLLREMGTLGLLGLLVPEEWGGIGMSTVGFVAAMEQIGLADQSLAAAWQAHVTIGSLPLYLFGTDAQRERWLRPLAEGRSLGAFGLTEPDAGSDARGIRTRAVRRDGGWLINGRKTFISNAGTDMSFGVTLLARTEPAEGEGPAFASFVVEKGTPGFTTGPN